MWTATLLLCLLRCSDSQDLPEQLQLLPTASPPAPLQPARPQDLLMPVSRDAQTSEFYLRSSNPEPYGLAPYPLPTGYPYPPVGYQTSMDGPTTGRTSPLQSTGPRDPTGQLYGSGPNFTLEAGNGPMVPLFQADDVSLNPAVPFAGVVVQPQPNAPNPVTPYVAQGCNLTKAFPCAKSLSECLGGLVSPSPTPTLGPNGLPSLVDVLARQSLCTCYSRHSQCWAAIGCLDSLPQSDIDYCFSTLNCPQLSCMGSGAAAAGLAAGALLLALAASAALMA